MIFHRFLYVYQRVAEPVHVRSATAHLSTLLCIRHRGLSALTCVLHPFLAQRWWEMVGDGDWSTWVPTTKIYMHDGIL